MKTVRTFLFVAFAACLAIAGCEKNVSENGQGGDELDIALEVLGSGLYDVDYRIIR